MWVLFLNASGNRLTEKWHTKDAFYDYREWNSIMFNCCIEFSAFKLSRVSIKSVGHFYLSPLVLVPVLFHFFIGLIYKKELTTIESNYYSYYPRKLNLIYNIVAICSAVFTLYYFIYGA